MADGVFARGDEVRMHQQPERVGRIDGEPTAYGQSFLYPVFFSAGQRLQIPEWQLELVPVQRDARFLPREAFLRRLLLAKLDNPVTDLLYSFQASRTKPEAYQFKPVLKFLEAPVPGILIADEVGLGKTIEAAILYLELKARGEIDRVLIVCPAGLREKWQTELSTRFDENFQILDRKLIRRDLELYDQREGRHPLRGIIGLETIRAREIQDLLDNSSVRYDLVVIDEAHHLRTSGTLSNQIGERLRDLADNLVLLTATPLQTKVEDLFNLLSYVDEARFDDLGDFVAQLGPNAFLNAAVRALRGVPSDAAGARAILERLRTIPEAKDITAHPNYGPVMDLLAAAPLSRGHTVQAQRDIERMNVISSVYTRTKKADVTEVARRSATVVRVDLRSDEAKFYQAVLAHARAEAKARSASGQIPGFTGMMRERQAASCMTALAEAFLKRHPSDVVPRADAFDNDVVRENQPAPTASPVVALDEVLKTARSLGKPDSKLAVFRRTLDDALASSPGGKVIVFSFFRDTLTYLHTELVRAGYGVMTIHGGVPAPRRPALIDRFRTDRAVTVLLASEVGAEGLDFQFCDTLINYDLPWNPMKVEQRIGRIDRYGQKQPVVRILSLVLADTIEDRILTRLYERIGVFNDSIGELEPILGEITTELTTELFSNDLTPDQERELVERKLQMIETRRQLERELEEQQGQVLGNDALLVQVIDDGIASGRYVSAAELEAITQPMVRHANAELRVDAFDRTASLTPTTALARLVHDHAIRGVDSSPDTEAFVARLGSGKPIPLTFDGSRALERRLLELVTPRHPLVRAAVEYARRTEVDSKVPVVNLVVGRDRGLDPALSAGVYTFALFLAAFTGARTLTRLIGIVIDAEGRRVPDVEAILLRLVQEDSHDGADTAWTTDEESRARDGGLGFAAEEAELISADVRRRNEGMISLHAASLRRTYGSKITRRKRLHDEAKSEPIRRLRDGEIRNLTAELDRRLGDLERGREVGFTIQELGAGRLEITFPRADATPAAHDERVISPAAS